MGGGLMQLIAYVTYNGYLIGNPSVTFYKAVHIPMPGYPIEICIPLFFESDFPYYKRRKQKQKRKEKKIRERIRYKKHKKIKKATNKLLNIITYPIITDIIFNYTYNSFK